MAKRIISILMAILILSFAGCGIEVKVDASSNMEEDRTIYCTDCEKEKGLDTLIVED